MEATTISLAILSMLVVLSNGTICALVVCRRSLRKPGNALIVSLAASDIITGAVLIPLHLAVPSSPVNGYLLAASLVTGVASVCAVTTDRYLAVLRPFQYKIFMRRNFRKMILATWIVPALVSLLPLIWREEPSAAVHNVYLYVICVAFVMVPYFLVFAAYVRIFHQIRAHGKLLTAPSQQSRGRKRFPAEAKVAKIFFIVVVSFLVSWSPILYATMAFASDRRDLVPPFLATVSLFMLDLSSLINPFLYCAGKQDVRGEFKRLLTRERNPRTAHWEWSLLYNSVNNHAQSTKPGISSVNIVEASLIYAL